MSLIPRELMEPGGTRGLFDPSPLSGRGPETSEATQARFDALLKLPHVVKQKGGAGGWQVFFGASPYYAFCRRSDARICARALQDEILRALAGAR